MYKSGTAPVELGDFWGEDACTTLSVSVGADLRHQSVGPYGLDHHHLNLRVVVILSVHGHRPQQAGSFLNQYKGSVHEENLEDVASCTTSLVLKNCFEKGWFC